MKKTLILLPVILLCLCGFRQRAPRQAERDAAGPGEVYEQAVDCYESGDLSGAADAFTRAIELGQNRADAYVGRADSYLAMAVKQKTAYTNGPDRVTLAVMDYRTAIALSETGIDDPAADGLGRAADYLLSKGDIARAMECLQLALDASDGDVQARVRAKAGELVRERTVSTAAWYTDAAPDRYYEFFGSGAGRIIDTENMEITDTLTYTNDGFGLRITEDSSGRTYEWTFSPEEQRFYESAAGNGDGVVKRVTMKRVFQKWRDQIDVYFTYGMDYEWPMENGQTGMTEGAADTAEKCRVLLDAIIETQAQTLSEEDAAKLRAERAAWEEERFQQSTDSGMAFFGGSAQAMVMAEASVMYYEDKIDLLLSEMADHVVR